MFDRAGQGENVPCYKVKGAHESFRFFPLYMRSVISPSDFLWKLLSFLPAPVKNTIPGFYSQYIQKIESLQSRMISVVLTEHLNNFPTRANNTFDIPMR